MSVGVVLIDPKFAFNVGNALRACHQFGAGTLKWTGHRVTNELSGLRRLPREERMKEYGDVDWHPADSWTVLDDFTKQGMTPVAVEVREQAEDLHHFVHPENAVYVFGPEDGSLDKGILSACHRFVRIPTPGCLNLAAAVNVVLYDRSIKATFNQTLERQGIFI